MSKSPLFEQFQSLKPLFKNNEEALTHYSKQLEAKLEEHKMTILEMEMAGESEPLNDEWEKVCSLIRKVNVLKGMIARGET